MAYYKTSNARTWNTSGTAEYPATVVEQQYTLENPRDTDVTPAEHPGTTEAYKMKKNYSVLKEI